ncbi:MAG: FAD-dependent oxidoreductase [Streptococcus sp.]
MSKDEDYLQDQIPCWLTYTNQESHDIINNNLHRAQCFQVLSRGRTSLLSINRR